MLKFRDLRADEIDVRVQQVKSNGVALLLYKDARCDMNLLDETVGPERWQRSHSRENANCTVSIYFPEMGQWVSKEDTGTESNTEADKGLASDSFKRACFNWGCGRELYTGPKLIWVTPDKCNIKTNQGGYSNCYDKFEVASIEITNKVITKLSIRNLNTKQICFEWARKSPQSAQTAPKQNNQGNTQSQQKNPTQATTGALSDEQKNQQMVDKANNSPVTNVDVQVLRELMNKAGVAEIAILNTYKVAKLEDMLFAQWNNARARLEATIKQNQARAAR